MMFILVLTCFMLYIVSRFINGFRMIQDGFIIIGFLYFLYKVWTEYVWKFESLFDLILILIFTIYATKDILWGIRVVGLSIPLTSKIVLKYIDLKNFLQDKVRTNLGKMREISLIVSFFLIFWIQIKIQLPHINFNNHSLIEILGFDVAIFSMYGIYVAFLQFLTENDKVYYLGISKFRFMLDNSVWSQLTRTRMFRFILIAIVLIPLVSKSNIEYIDRIRDLEYLWQTCYIISIVIYIFLLTLNLDIAYGVFNLNLESVHKAIEKEEPDKRVESRRLIQIGVSNRINISIQRSFKDEFWTIYKNPTKYREDYISIRLSERIKFVEKADRDELIFTIFGREFWENHNLSDSIFEYLENVDSNKAEQFFRFYKNFCRHKWELLKDYQSDISSYNWKALIEQDITIFEKLVNSDPTLQVLRIEYPEIEKISGVGFSQDKKIREFLFEFLIEKESIDIDEIIRNIKDELRDTKRSYNDDENKFINYKKDFLKFKLELLFEKYEKKQLLFELPKFLKLSKRYTPEPDSFDDYENSILYSELCFNYLDRGRIEDFSQTIIEKDDSEEEQEQKLKAQKIKNLILSMNEEYRLAFMLYQLFYTDYTEWDENLEFYDNEIKKLMRNNKQHGQYLFESAKNIILQTNINYCITERFLNRLWETRTEMITDFSWFKQFGTRHLLSECKILYIQWLLSGKDYFHNNRFYIERRLPKKVRYTLVGNTQIKISLSQLDKIHWQKRHDRQKVSKFCRDYLLLSNRLPSMFTRDTFSSENNDLQLSAEYLLLSKKANLSEVVEKLPIDSLLRLEWILSRNYYRYTDKSLYSSETFFRAMRFHSKYYWSGEDGVVEFYVLKRIDNFYENLYRDREFLEGLKNEVRSQINFINKSIPEYVEHLSEKVAEFKKVSQLEKENIISYLNSLVFSESFSQFKMKAKKPRRYR